MMETTSRVGILACILWLLAAPATLAEDKAYGFESPSPDGIGRTYMGREISQILGYGGIAWLEREQRLLQERPDVLVSELEIDTNAVVADIGAGGGYLTFRLARRVPAGKVIAVEIDPKMLERIGRRAREAEIENVETLLGQEEDTGLEAGSVDLALIVDAYHEFTYPREMMQSILRGLKPGGQVVLVEYRAEDPRLPIKPLHKMTEAQARLELEAVGLVWRETLKILPWQHVMIFEKPRAEGG